MPLFKARNFDESDYDESSVESALKETGLEKHLVSETLPPLPSEVIEFEDPKEIDDTRFRKILNKNGASVDQASRTIAQIMRAGKFENSQLKAAEMVLDLHGIRDKEGKLAKQAVFNFIINDSSVNIQNIFAPTRTTASLSESLED